MKKEAKERRKAVRVEDWIPIDYRLLTAQQYEEELKLFPTSQSGVEHIELKYPFFSWKQRRYREEEEPNTTEQVILDLLVSLNNKLDSLIRLLKKEKELELEDLCLKEPTYVNISGAGIRFISDQPIKKEAFLKLQICVPLFPSFVIPALGRVAWTEKKDRGYEIGVEFTAIHEDDRDALIHYIFIRQRRLIRKAKSHQ